MVESTPYEFWPVAQRLLVFEEPWLKWLHLKRWLKRTSRKIFHLDATSSEMMQLLQLFDQLLGFKQEDIANHKKIICRIFSVLFSLEESKRFLPGALQHWQSDSNLAEINKTDNDSFVCLEKEQSRQSWLRFAFNFTPNWQLPVVASSEDQDARLLFIREFTSRIEQEQQLISPNIQWLALEVLFQKMLQEWRGRLPGHFLPNLIILAEGVTEIILLPWLAKNNGLDLNAAGVMLLSAGGANQVVKKYFQLKETVAIPIFCLLDHDAQVQANEIKGVLRSRDNLYVLESGEIEDLFKLESLISLLNAYLVDLPHISGYSSPISSEDFLSNSNRSTVLDKLWRERDLGKFDKVGFAKFVADSPCHAQEISLDGRMLLESITAHAGLFQ